MRLKRFVYAATCAVVLASAPSGGATLPGKNGTVVFKRYFVPDKWSALFTINADGKGEKPLTHTARDVTDDQPDWSPDASSIVFTRRTPSGPSIIYTVRRDGSGLKRVSPEPCLPGPPQCEDGANASFTPDGRHVVYTRATGHERYFANGGQIEHSDIVVRDADGRNPRVVISAKPYRADYNAPQFSPNGQGILYVRVNSPLSKPALKRALFVARANGQASRRITPWSLNGGDNPDWAPNGKLIVFRSHDDEVGVQSQLYVVRPDGRGLRALTHFKPGTEVFSYSFSPDGKWILFAKSGTGGLPDLFIVRPNGNDIRPVTHTKLWESAPDWGSTH